jgi:type I restriction enzyme S subunit
MQDLLTKGIDENGQIRSEETHRFKDSELGRIPEEWEVVELGKVGIEFIDGDRGVNYPHQGELLKDGYCLFLNNKNIESGKFVFNEAQYISKEKDSALGSGRLKFGDIVITTRGTVGNMAFFNYQNLIVRINSGMIILRNYQHIFDPYFFIYLWLFSLPKKLRILGSGSAQPQLPLRDLRKFKFVSSPLSEQHRIAQILSQIDETIEKEQKYKEKLERIKQGLMQDLLTGKVRVNSLIEEVKNEADCKNVLLRHCEPAKGRRSNLKRKINV